MGGQGDTIYNRMKAYYNEIDKYAAQWLRNLIAEGLIVNGDVDERSIEDVKPDELLGYTQCHFFAGIGGWSFALRLAGWPDDRPVWTGSCPCQPFSVANTGDRLGKQDRRHLWPSMYRLISLCKPSVVLGEQVESAIKLGWLDEAFGDMERSNYACAAAVLPALSVGAKHERKRLYWVANASSERREGYQSIGIVSGVTGEAQSINSNPLTESRRILDGGNSGLLSNDGVSIAVERSATKGYGNAIVPQAAAEFIKSYMECIP